VFKVTKVLMGRKVLKVRQAHGDRLALRAFKGIRVWMANRALKVNLVYKAQQGPRACVDRKASKVIKASRDLLDHKVRLVLLDRWDLKALLVTKGQQEIMVNVVVVQCMLKPQALHGTQA
jgi:hypothetical protein